MRTFYLLELALEVNSVAELENGLNNLNSLVVDRDEEKDNLICSHLIWECNTTQGFIYELCYSIVSQELQRIVPYIFQSFTEQQTVYDTTAAIDAAYPNDYNAFMGINFTRAAIPTLRQILDPASYGVFVKHCLKDGVIQNDTEMKENLSAMFPTFDFTPRAIRECLHWKNQSQGLYDKLFELFVDIPINPFTGGIGETEVLKHDKRGIASKRINQAHRVTYKLENNRVKILACSGHYT